jgi:hypothetical protein
MSERDSQLNLHSNPQALALIMQGHLHDAFNPDHESEALAKQIILSQPRIDPASIAVAGYPVYRAPVFDIESPPLV